MRRSSKGYGQRQAPQQQLANTGTIKSVERHRGTGSIGPDHDAPLQADTGFTSEAVDGIDFTTLAVGDRVQFDGSVAADRPGYADASLVQPADGLADDESSDRDDAPELSAAEQAVKNQEAALASGEENPG